MSRDEPGIAREVLAGEGAGPVVVPFASRAWRRESLVFLVYCVLYLVYLFLWPENELLHWVSLVVLPLLIVLFLGSRSGSASLPDALASVGLRRGNLRRGIVMGAVVGIVVSVLQLGVSERRTEIWDIVVSGRVLYLLPLTIVLMLVTAGFTEEFFFRGVMLTRLERWWRSPWLAVPGSAVLFVFYHLPYAYLDPSWPTHGHLLQALGTVAIEAGILGLVLGAIYVRARDNLLASVVAHTLCNALPAMALIKFGGG